MSYRGLLWVILAFLVLLTGALGQSQAQADGLPNIVLIIADCLRTDHVDAMGDDGLLLPYVVNAAANGVWFRNAVSPSSWTSTATSSFLTSLDVDTHQVYQVADTLPSDLETMAEYLKSNGYSTACVQMNGNLTPQLGYSQGFDTYDHVTNVLAEVATTQALQRIASMTEPFFLYIHYVATHVPFRSPTPYRTAEGYPPAGLSTSERTVIENYLFEYYADHLSYQFGIIPAPTYTPFSPTGREAVHLLYHVGAQYTDDQVAQVMAAVNGRSPDPYLIFTADHGEHFWEHGYIGHAMTLYEEVVRVPLILTGPGITPAVSDANVTTLDLLPTLAGLLDLPARGYWQGRDLFAPRDPAGPTFAYTQGMVPPRDVDLEMARWGSWKLIFDRNVAVPMLFDVLADPQESANLAEHDPAIVQQLKAMLDARRLVDALKRPAEGWVTPIPCSFPEQGMPIALAAPPGQEYQWMKDGAYLVEDWPHITEVASQGLCITPATSADLGRYECVYRDTDRRLRITRPYDLSLLPPKSVPTTNKPGLVLLIFILAVAATLTLTRRLGIRHGRP